jgi:hypothetical protein
MSILDCLARYYVLTREQLQQLNGQEESSGRGMRKHLLRLRNADLLVMHRMQITLPERNGAAPVYYPTKKGAETLASYFGSDSYLSTNTKHPRADRLAHWIVINDVRMLVEAAARRIPSIQLLSWITEWQTINADDAKGDQFCLHTQISETPPLSCSPDAAFLLEFKNHRMVFYVEADRGTSSPRQIAARKSKGFAQLSNRKLHRKHFPETTLDRFRVLFFTTNHYRAQKTQEEMQSKPGKELWLMIDGSQVTADNLFTGPVAIDHEGVAGPLIHIANSHQLDKAFNSEPHAAAPATSQ